jgi:hypothetical protein
MSMIELVAANGSLLLQNKEWSQVSVKFARNETLLGADSLSILTRRLFDALSSSNLSSEAGMVGGVEADWVTTLSEQHCALYVSGRGVDGSCEIIIIDCARSYEVGRLRLGNSDVSRWITQLSEEPL